MMINIDKTKELVLVCFRNNTNKQSEYRVQWVLMPSVRRLCINKNIDRVSVCSWLYSLVQICHAICMLCTSIYYSKLQLN